MFKFQSIFICCCVSFFVWKIKKYETTNMYLGILYSYFHTLVHVRTPAEMQIREQRFSLLVHQHPSCISRTLNIQITAISQSGSRIFLRIYEGKCVNISVSVGRSDFMVSLTYKCIQFYYDGSAWLQLVASRLDI